MGSKKKIHDEYIDEFEESAIKYARGSIDFNTSKSKHKAIRLRMQDIKTSIKQSAIAAANSEILLPQQSGLIEVEKNEKIYHITQKNIKDNIDLNTQKNIFDFQLTKFGPYNINFSRNGRQLLMCGRKGHIATYDCLRTAIGTELQLQEDCYDSCYLHNDTLFAVAQNRYT
jgi:U3 small nucleolar RNA-associated protein 7